MDRLFSLLRCLLTSSLPVPARSLARWRSACQPASLRQPERASRRRGEGSGLRAAELPSCRKRSVQARKARKQKAYGSFCVASKYFLTGFADCGAHFQVTGTPESGADFSRIPLHITNCVRHGTVHHSPSVVADTAAEEASQISAKRSMKARVSTGSFSASKPRTSSKWKRCTKL